ncbi:ADP-ribosylglycohydrolase family protein [Niabella aquatica]
MTLICTWGVFFTLLPLNGYCDDSQALERVVNKEKRYRISKSDLSDKIKGGWAGQVIGVTFGSVTEFKYNGTFIQDYQPVEWYDGYIKEQFHHWPDLYDDIYMDLTFVEVIERCGYDSPVDSFANAFANAGYTLWHANQAARYNILNGIKAPQSGHWYNNPHADDIDFQIEADFLGLMHPGMPNAAADYGDPIGHIMSYGDGWYGGVFASAMYSLAFTSDDISFIIKEALKTIPEKSTFYKCISNVINWHKEHPSDWKQTWFEVQKKWTSEVGCPEGVFEAFNIDAKVNMAYVVIGLLYGGGDFSRTMEIATRCGQDSDCNPATAAGILGTILGYDNISEYWKKGLHEIEQKPFKHTTLSLDAVYNISYKHALEMIRRNGGIVDEDVVIIPLQKARPVRLEQSFKGLLPVAKKFIQTTTPDEINFDFNGTGFALRGEAVKPFPEAPDHIFEADVYINDTFIETFKLSTDFRVRRYELLWKYGLKNDTHHVKVLVKNPLPGYAIKTGNCIFYRNRSGISNED